jgi:hypothetical protein
MQKGSSIVQSTLNGKDTQNETAPESKTAKPIILTGDRGLKFSDLDSMYRFCVACANSKEFKDITTPEQALIRLQAGLELGLTPIWSITNIMVVNGRPAVWGDALLGLVLARPDCEDVIETFEGGVASCEVRRKGREPKIRKFSEADARKAGLFDKPGPWKSYPQRMLQMRARAWACRDSYADALRGLGVIEEMRDAEEIEVRPPVKEKPLILPEEATATSGPDAESREAEGALADTGSGDSEMGSHESGPDDLFK